MSGPTPGDETSQPALPPDHPDRAFSPEATAASAPAGSDRADSAPADGDPAGPDDADVTVLADPADLPPSSSLSPADRVIPSWTDPTVRRASDLVGGPLGRHAQVGRNRLITPLRVCLMFGIVVLALGWMFKSPCIQQGGDSAQPTLDQSGQRPWLTGCYNDVVPLYGSRGFDRPQDFPYANSFIELKDGGERRIYPADIVTPSGDGFQAATPKGPVQLSDKDIVGDADSGYREVQGNQLVPVGNIDDLGQVRYLEYPVLTGLFQWGVSWTTEGYLNLARSSGILPVPLDVAAYFTIGAIFLALFYLWAIACTARMSRKRIWDTAIMCLSPLLVVHAFTNWDLLAVGLCAGGMWAWSRNRPVLSGVLLGLGMAAKLYPILLLGPLLVLCLRAGKMGAWVRAMLGAAVAVVAVNLPVLLAYPHAWYEFIRLNSERPPEWDSWYFLFAHITGSKIWDNDANADTPTFLNNLSLLLFLLACAAIGWFALSVRRRPRFAQLAFLVVAAFLLTNKVWSPQYSIWLLPLVALALPRWRPVMIWQISEVVVWMLLMFQFAGVDNKGLSVEPFVGAAIIRGALVIMLIVMVIRDALRPERDLVRQTGDDDPTGGVLENQPDRFTLPSLPTLVRRLHDGGRRTDEPLETVTARPVLTAVPGEPEPRV
ncbi:glycosyltransferase family 87 protein [Nakamurella lactea]|uniref:glycosyltransferase family 87 protein n=1 Tax=Nakamurella lactea TaxID=459515 RepID=UPI0003F550E8|nr:glycosyltransferase 87 family protein [Nakamurella lactea]